LPEISGWINTPRKIRDGDIIFEARNPGKIIYLFLSVETLNSDLEDYYLLLKVANKLDAHEGFRHYGKSLEVINDEKTLKYVYSVLINDPKVGQLDVTYTNYLFKKYEMNYRLVIYTLSENYEKKRNIIEGIANGFRFVG